MWAMRNCSRAEWKLDQ